MIRIVSTWTGDSDVYRRLAAVLEHSARRHNPAADIAVVNTDARPTGRGADAFERKARDWTQAIAEAPDGTELVLLDTDMLVLGELSPAFSQPFDLAVTTRGGVRTLNSGALFVRVSDRVRRFFAPWQDRTRPWCAKNRIGAVRFGDQDALIAMLLEMWAAGGANPALHAVELPCAIWNAQQDCWPPVADCRIVHVKSDARRILFGGHLHGQRGADAVAAMWSFAEADALRDGDGMSYRPA